MTDDRIGTVDKHPTKTICGHDVHAQFIAVIGIGKGRCVIIGYDDVNYQDELERLMAVPAQLVRKHKKGAIDGQDETEGKIE